MLGLSIPLFSGWWSRLAGWSHEGTYGEPITWYLPSVWSAQHSGSREASSGRDTRL